MLSPVFLWSAHLELFVEQEDMLLFEGSPVSPERFACWHLGTDLSLIPVLSVVLL